MNRVILLTFALCGVFLWMGVALADNITIYDNRSSNPDWHGMAEDQEVEPGMQHGQQWDLEAFCLDGNILSVIGGFDFVKGVGTIGAGDIFIDKDLTALYGDAAYSASDASPGKIYNLGWDYVFDVDWGSAADDGLGKYDLYALTGEYELEDVYYYNSPESSPYRLLEVGEAKLLGDGDFSVVSNLDDAAAGFLGGTHYKATGFDLTPIFDDAGSQAFLAHLTEKCGNDNLIGKHAVPEPDTMMLLGVGLIGIAGFGRKKFKKGRKA